MQPEPWLRGTHGTIGAVPRAVIHALELAEEDLNVWCRPLYDQELRLSASGLPSIAFQIRHIIGSVDRLLTYAEGAQLNTRQLTQLQSEDALCDREKLFEDLAATLAQAAIRVVRLGENSALLEQGRTVGRMNLPSTVAGLLIHVAEHTQRHVGQAITTSKIIIARRE